MSHVAPRSLREADRRADVHQRVMPSRRLALGAEARVELERLNKESEAIIRQARVEGEQIIGASRADAERLRGELRDKARAEAEGILRNAERQIQLETARAVQQIRTEAADLSVAIASKLIQRNLTRADNEKLIQDALNQLPETKN